MALAMFEAPSLLLAMLNVQGTPAAPSAAPVRRCGVPADTAAIDCCFRLSIAHQPARREPDQLSSAHPRNDERANTDVESR